MALLIRKVFVMIQKSKIFPVMAIFALLSGLSACSSQSQIEVADNLGASTGLPEVTLRVEDLTTSHRQIRDRFGALETLYIDLRKSNTEQSDMVDEVENIMTENEVLKRDLLAVKTRLQRSETLSNRLMDRITALETAIADNRKTSMGSTSGGSGGQGVANSTPEKPLYAVHLASFRESSQINTGWTSLRNKFPRTLGGLNAKVETSTLPQLGSFLRLLAGPFASLSEAKSLCDSLQLQNQYCKPAPFMGETIE